MTNRDVLTHPDLRRALGSIESAATDLEWAKVAPGKRLRRRASRVLTIGLAIGVLIAALAGNETSGVFAARRAIASGIVVGDQTVTLFVTTSTIESPWPSANWIDETLVGTGVRMRAGDETSSSEWLLGPDLQWTRLSLEGSVIDLAQFDDATYAAVVGEDTTQRGVWRYHGSDSAWSEVLSLDKVREVQPHVDDLAVDGSRLVAVGSTSSPTLFGWRSEAMLWTSTDGEEWVEADIATEGAISDVVSNGTTAVAVGKQDRSLPLVELVDPVVWRSTGQGNWEPVEIEGLGPLGFGYLIGGFRLHDGLEHVTLLGDGFFAYSGLLQIWGGLEDWHLEPEEAWSSLILLSPDGATWEPHVLSDFGIFQVIAFGDGLLATAARRPDANTEFVEDPNTGEEIEVAVSPPVGVYHSVDGLTWNEVAGLPDFDRPLLMPVSDNRAHIVDTQRIAQDSDFPSFEVRTLSTG